MARVSIPNIDGTKVPAVWHFCQEDRKRKGDADIVILAHGIFSDKDERGRFIRQAKLHVERGSESIRFDFRGHGEHSLPSRDVTVCGMILDFKSVLDYAKSRTKGRLFVVASSFGASILLLYLQTANKSRPSRIVLLNPVVDYKATLLEATLPWGKGLFNEAGFEELERTGFITLEEGFRMKAEMVTELDLLRPYETFKTLSIPTRVIHGNKDSKVPYSVTRKHAMTSSYVDFQTITGADHAFKPIAHERTSFDLILDWLYRRGHESGLLART